MLTNINNNMYHSKDLVGLYEAYSNINRHEYLDNKRIILEQELNSLYIVNEDAYEAAKNLGGSIVNVGRNIFNKGEEAVQNVIGQGVGAVQDIIDIPAKLQQYYNEALPQFIDKLGEFLKVVLISGASGAVLTQVVGRLLLMFSKKLQKAGEDNEEIIKRMLDDEIVDSIEKIKDLKQTNPNEYRRQVFKINQNALKELRAALNSTTKQAGSAVMQKILKFFGEVLSSAPGSLFGGIAVAYLIQKLGFNPMPVFPTLNLGN